MKWSVFIVLLSAGFANGQMPALDWVKQTDKAGWQPRDSSGEVVFKDQLWIMGGWFDSFSALPRDVWSSADGKAWKLITKEVALEVQRSADDRRLQRPDVAHGRLV